MSTNFYIRKEIKEACRSCGSKEEYELIHICKRSPGHRFKFASKESGCYSFLSIKEFLKENRNAIIDEHDNYVDVIDLISSIMHHQAYDIHYEDKHLEDVIIEEGFVFYNFEFT